ncbi:hypothetical protein C2I27_03900 [Priestia megaterium]|uniref:hypothetical protein n=1 Tax=Priestia megaterium TaxID=1404 RepID=UPI000D51D663|nr:hypothetical protein [Priestia megaterium]PVC75040.1 hypothetical protein C2I27_03900 [Priestia megaterium]
MSERFELEEELIERLDHAINIVRHTGVGILTEEKPLMELLKGALRENYKSKYKMDVIKNIKRDLAANEDALKKHEQDQKEFEQLISKIFGASKVKAFIERVESVSEAKGSKD